MKKNCKKTRGGELDGGREKGRAKEEERVEKKEVSHGEKREQKKVWEQGKAEKGIK